jgi:hypothetical protein
MLCASKEYISDPTMAEAVAAWRAVELACRLDLQGIMLKGDSLDIVQALRKIGSCWILYGQVVNETKMLGHHQVWEVNHVRSVTKKRASAIWFSASHLNVDTSYYFKIQNKLVSQDNNPNSKFCPTHSNFHSIAPSPAKTLPPLLPDRRPLPGRETVTSHEAHAWVSPDPHHVWRDPHRRARPTRDPGVGFVSPDDPLQNPPENHHDPPQIRF